MTQLDSTSTSEKLARRFKFRQAIRTDVGLKREENQDAYGYAHTSQVSIYIVADGMGGARGGATASSLAVDSVLRGAIDQNGNITEQSLRTAIDGANTLIFEHSREDESLTGMGTTLVAVALVGDRAIIGHVGDSRIYHLRNNEVKQLTKDHTLVQELVDSGSISPEEAAHHPISHMLTRSLGPAESVEIDSCVLPEPVQPKERFMLCCDGLFNLLSHEEIADILKSCEPETAVQQFLDTALERGAPDNVTVEVIEVHALDDASVTVDLPEEGKIRVVTSGSFEGDRFNGAAQRRKISTTNSAQKEDLAHREEIEPEGGAEEIDQFSERQALREQDPLPKGFQAVFFGCVFIIIVIFAYVAFVPSEPAKQTTWSQQKTSPTLSLIDQLPNEDLGWTKAMVVPSPEPPSGSAGGAAVEGQKEASTVGPDPLPGQEQQSSQPTKIDALSLKSIREIQLAKVIEQKAQIREQIADLDAQLWLLDANSVERLKKRRGELDTQLKTAQRALVQTQEVIETNKKEVALWRERKKSFSVQEVMSFAEDVSPVDEEVQARKDDYHLTQVRFREIVSLYQVNPTDANASNAMDESRKELNNQLLILEQAVRNGIDRGLQNATVRLSESILQQAERKRHLERLTRHLALVDGAQPKESPRDPKKEEPKGEDKGSISQLLRADDESQRKFLKERETLTEQLYTLRSQLSDQEELALRRAQTIDEIVGDDTIGSVSGAPPSLGKGPLGATTVKAR